MSSFEFLVNLDPQSVAATFKSYIRAMVSILLWAIIGFATLSAAILAFRIMWAVIKFAWNL